MSEPTPVSPDSQSGAKRIAVLMRRADFLRRLLEKNRAEKAPSSDQMSRERSELAALEWAVHLLDRLRWRRVEVDPPPNSGAFVAELTSGTITTLRAIGDARFSPTIGDDQLPTIAAEQIRRWCPGALSPSWKSTPDGR